MRKKLTTTYYEKQLYRLPSFAISSRLQSDFQTNLDYGVMSFT